LFKDSKGERRYSTDERRDREDREERNERDDRNRDHRDRDYRKRDYSNPENKEQFNDPLSRRKKKYSLSPS